MDELDERGGAHAGVASHCIIGAAGASGEYHQQWAQALAATADDVLGNLVHERHNAVQTGAYGGIDGRQIVGHEGADAVKLGCRRRVCFQLRFLGAQNGIQVPVSPTKNAV
jgi:hypothetical protein